MRNATFLTSLRSLTDKVVLLTTATNGLYADRGSICLGVAMLPMSTEIGGKQAGEEVHLFRQAPDFQCADSQEYHKITPDILRTKGIPYNDFFDRLSEELQGKFVVTYNVRFQQQWLPDTSMKLQEIYYLHQLINMPTPVEVEDLLKDPKASMRSDLGTIAALEGVCKGEHESSRLPLFNNLHCLKSIWQAMLAA